MIEHERLHRTSNGRVIGGQSERGKEHFHSKSLNYMNGGVNTNIQEKLVNMNIPMNIPINIPRNKPSRASPTRGVHILNLNKTTLMDFPSKGQSNREAQERKEELSPKQDLWFNYHLLKEIKPPNELYVENYLPKLINSSFKWVKNNTEGLTSRHIRGKGIGLGSLPLGQDHTRRGLGSRMRRVAGTAVSSPLRGNEVRNGSLPRHISQQLDTTHVDTIQNLSKYIYIYI